MSKYQDQEQEKRMEEVSWLVVVCTAQVLFRFGN